MRFILVFASMALVACSSSDTESTNASDVVADTASDGSDDVASALPVGFNVVVQTDHPGLLAAAADLVDVAGVQAAWAGGAIVPNSGDRYAVVVVVVDASGPDDQGYRLSTRTTGLPGVDVVANTPVGAMNGLYQIAQDLGAFWIHPEEGHVVPQSIPTYPGEWTTPRYDRRGFHEHTQHPIPMSDYLLRPTVGDHRERVSRYLRWMARNRQNVLFFHALKTLDLATWVPAMKAIAADASGYGIHMGAVIGFADEQQHAFKLIATGASGDDADDDIRAGLDAVLASGLKLIGFQIGTSEFTKPADAEVLRWLDVATSHVRDAHPDVRPYAWIHITCSLLADNGGKFFHLPLQADASLGAFVHTTMFYTLTDPAPVYDCEDFSHQVAFIEAAEADRELVFFPETAWWLGFDNNVPLVLPITGLSRERDMDTLDARPDDGARVTGHVTFTSGREWTYWQYDHFLTRATWRTETWAQYLDATAGLFGPSGAAAAGVVKTVTALQEKLLYQDNPEAIFYLAGELTQDEVGAQIGILARRPKIAFKDVWEYDAATYDTWKVRDLDRLTQFQLDMAEALQDMPSAADGEPLLLTELRRSYTLLHRRAEHTVLLYGAIGDIRAKDRGAAEKKLVEARLITDEVKEVVAATETAIYRDPLTILAEPKPETLTAYPIGYLAETRTAFFWSRRDDQLADLIELAFAADADSWPETAPQSVYRTEGESVLLTKPASELGSSILASFIPPLLFGVTLDGVVDSAKGYVEVGEDANGNDLPDGATVTRFKGSITAGRFLVAAERLELDVRDSSSKVIATMILVAPRFSFSIDGSGKLGSSELAADFETKPLIDAVMANAGIDRAGIESLVKSIFELPADEPLPALLPVVFDVDPGLPLGP